MIIVKAVLMILILAISIFIGICISNRYSKRVKDLMEMQEALNIFEEKIKFTYEPIPDVFEEISKKFNSNIGEIFRNASIKMKIMSAGEAWENSLETAQTSMIKDDIEVLKGLAKMLGKTDLDGQVSEIKLTNKFLETKIKDSEIECKKNQKLFRTLGTTVGLAIVIVLI